MSRTRVAELVLWPLAIALLALVMMQTLAVRASGTESATSGVGQREITEDSAVPSLLETARPAALADPFLLAPLFGWQPRQEVLAAPSPDPGPAPVPAELAAWLRYVGTVSAGESTIHYFADEHTGALIRVSTEAEAEWTVESRESSEWVVRHGDARYRVKAP
jgi:hypothetical protein